MSQFPNERDQVCHNPKCKFNKMECHLGCQTFILLDEPPVFHEKRIERIFCAKSVDNGNDITAKIFCKECAMDPKVLKEVLQGDQIEKDD